MVDADRPQMIGRDFDVELRAEEASRHAEGIPAGIRRSVWARLERLDQTAAGGRKAERGRWRALTIAGATAVAAIGIVVAVLRPATRLADLDVARRSSDLATHVDGGLLAIERGAATLVDRPSGLSIETVGPVSLRREGHGVRLVRGRIDVTVAPRPPAAAPAAILVSDGAIEVTGTAFTVVQDRAGGRVALREGHIRFRAQDGTVVSLRPGEALAWPLPAAPPPSSPPAAPPAPPATTPAPSRAPTSASAAARPAADEALLDHVEALRSRGQFERAARALHRALSVQPNPMREQLSFELGSLLTHQIRDARRACAQWTWHDRHFPGGRYRHEVVRARAALACRARSEAP
jgi:transmembrane sensor